MSGTASDRLLAPNVSGVFATTHWSVALAAWQSIDSVVGLGRKGEAGPPPELQALLEARQTARKAKDFKRADAIRDELKAKGWLIEDTPKGARLKPVEEGRGELAQRF